MKENKNFKKGIQGEYKYVKPNTSGVYILYNDITLDFYIGSSSDINVRLSHHFGDLLNKKHICYRLQENYNNYSYDDFSFNYIELDNKELYINIEKYLLKKHHNNPKLLNTSTLNNNWINDRNLDLKNKHKQKMSNIASNRVGEKNPFYNKTHTEETKEKISKAKMGKPNLHDSQKCVIDGRLYDSLTQASKLLDIPIATISTRIRSKNKLFVNWYKLKTHNVVEVLDDRVLDIDSKNITCLFSINNKFYYNIDSICGDFGISKNTITNRCNSKKEEFKYWFKLI